MDIEAQMILEDTISFCERDGLDARLINMLGQCIARELTDDSLVIEAPSRFAYSYLMKHRETLERYLEEITFAPLALSITAPGPVRTDAAEVSRETPGIAQTGEPAPIVAGEPKPATPQTAVPVPPQPAVRVADDDSDGSSRLAVAAAGLERITDVPAQRSEGPDADPTMSHAMPTTTSAVPSPWSAMPAAGRGSEHDAASHDKVTITNTISARDLRHLMATPETPARPAAPAPAVERAVEAAGAPLDDTAANSKFTFENFVYGDENKHAYNSAALFAAMADEPGTYTSLFIYGNSGLGKTHLLLAIKNYLNEHSPHLRVKYANSQAYIDDFINEVALQKNDGRTILKAYHEADILIIDDIQNIIGKTASIDYFFRLMDEFIRNNKKIAIASDRAPKNLGMDERLTSRFNAGMLCLVSEPGFEMKLTILKRYYENTVLPAAESQARAREGNSLLSSIRSGRGHLTKEQLDHMARVSGTNIRELESFCERCAGESFELEQEGRELTGDDIDRIANEYFDSAHKKISVETVQKVVEDFYHVSHGDLIGPRRTADIKNARHVAVYLALDMCEMTMTSVGAAFGGRDHSTVVNSIKVVEKKLKADRAFVDDLQQLRNKIILRS